MPRISRRAGNAARFATLIAVLLVSGCSLLPVDEPPVDEPDFERIEPLPPITRIYPEPLPRPPVFPPLPAIAIVLTSPQPAYAHIADELSRRFPDYAIYDLSDRDRPPVSVLRMINDSKRGTVVAIGLRAAQSSVAMAEAPVVFSQVFNYQDHDLVTARSRGVAALAPLDAQLAAWKKFDPTLTRIGAIVGDGHEELIAEAEIAAQRQDLKLNLQIARSDQETLYHFRRMIRDIDGYWLFPDNRILSPRVLAQMLEEANSLQVPVAVPNEAMLQMGAAISLSAIASDVADTIVRVIREIQAGRLEELPPITPLSEIRVATNDAQLQMRAIVDASSEGAEAGAEQ